ncbi:MFS transporter [Caulobacter sp. KR2-114]|uniref:MFS transporter n=1 Tax=Caulobacter sp. KR2-114 TaxID=3400912 RepID=UPI003C0BF436
MSHASSPARALGAHDPAPARIGWIVTALSFGFTVVQLDVTIVNVALPAIGADLRASTAALQWTVDAYTLAFAALLPSAGVIGDRLGARGAYLAGFVLFAAASAACGLAPNVALLVAARAAQGAGAALLVPTSLALVNRESGHDTALRARAVGYWTAAGGVSIALGPVIGGLLLAAVSWRAIFWVNLPVCALGAGLTLWCVRPAPGSRQGRGLDLPGQGLAILGLAALIGAVIESRPLGLLHPLVWGGAVAAAVAAALFVVVEARATAPMLPLGFLARPNFSPAVLFGVAVNTAYYGVLFVLSLYLQKALGFSALKAGLAYLPLTGTFIASNIASGRLVARFGPRLPMALGGAVGAAGYLLLSRLGAHSGLADMLPAFALIPAGMGLGVPAMTTAILASVPHRDTGVASAVLNTARQAGGAVGVAVFGALAGGGVSEIAPGLRTAALASAALVAAAALLSALAMRRPGQG